MKVTLHININEAMRLRAAFEGLDGYDQAVPGVENGPRVVRVPYKLGAARRHIAKNITALNTLCREFDEGRIALFREIWPGRAPEQGIREDEDAAGLARFKPEMDKMIAAKDDVTLTSIAPDVLDAAGEIPMAVLSTLEEFGLVCDDGQELAAA